MNDNWNNNNWNIIRSRLMKIFLEDCHFGIMLFFLEDPEWTPCYSTDEGIARYYRNLDKWELLAENDKVSWDILYSLYGGLPAAQAEWTRRRTEQT